MRQTQRVPKLVIVSIEKCGHRFLNVSEAGDRRPFTVRKYVNIVTGARNKSEKVIGPAGYAHMMDHGSS